MPSELFDDQTVVTDVAEILGGFEEVQHSEMVGGRVEHFVECAEHLRYDIKSSYPTKKGK